MKKTVWTFGLLSGAVSSCDDGDHDAVLAKDRLRSALRSSATRRWSRRSCWCSSVSGRIASAWGTLGFWRGVKVGILITVISSLCYVATWQVLSRTLVPDFIDQYPAHLMEKERAKGATPAELDARAAEMRQFKELYANPFVNVAFTFLEPFPVGLAMTLVSAAILRRKTRHRRDVAGAGLESRHREISGRRSLGRTCRHRRGPLHRSWRLHAPGAPVPHAHPPRGDGRSRCPSGDRVPP